MRLGYLGIGLMGAPMVENLLADGHEVTVWNRSPDKTEALLAKGAKHAARAADAAADGVILSCLADDAALDAVFADGSVLRALGQGGVHVSISTISAACATRLAAAHAAAGVHYVAAPIIGRPDAVRARVPSFLTAGDLEAKQRVAPVLEKLSRRIFDFGATPSAANVAKINFNFMIATTIEALSESFAVVEKHGIDARQFYEMVIGTAFGCPIFENYGRQLSQHGWDKVGFKLALGLKDVRLAQATAADVGARMRLGELLEARFSEALAHGHGDKDWTAIALEVRKEAGLVPSATMDNSEAPAGAANQATRHA
ncbi:MAG: NAD(P)-dependent oxidoreductase [Proteobacteria bacterium]|nr:NAD(P)-dependent oxidoreductase [Pseudomonadota bacterium]